ncbi:hypothetical protein Bca4012_058953 [Brassica carinata]
MNEEERNGKVVDEVVKENFKPIDIEKPVMEGAKLDNQDITAQGSSTKEVVNAQIAPDSAVNVDNTENEAWLTIPQITSPYARRKFGKSGKRLEVEIPTGSPSRYHLLSNEVEEGEVEEDNSEEEDSVEPREVLDMKKQMEKHVGKK